VIFALLLIMVLVAARQAGWLLPEKGRFTAIDGDSLRRGESEYRLGAIDAPELHQSCLNASGHSYACGREAQKALRRLVSGKNLECRISDTDRYGRLVATCFAEDADINGEMVRLGWAVAYRRHGLDYVRAEEEARRNRRGIWQGQFETPQDWRESHRNSLRRGGMAETSAPD
jgi:endonuclease YncB( thermonuclease family)